MTRDEAYKRAAEEREMDSDLEIIRSYIEGAYCSDDDEGGYHHPILEKHDKEKLFQACLSLSRRLKPPVTT